MDDGIGPHAIGDSLLAGAVDQLAKGAGGVVQKAWWNHRLRFRRQGPGKGGDHESAPVVRRV